LCSAEAALLDFNKLRIAGADHPLRIDEAVYVNCDPAAVHERKVRVPDQPDMVRPESLDKELLRVPPKTEHFAVTRFELLHVNPGRLIYVCLARRLIHVGSARARTHTRLSSAWLILVYAKLFVLVWLLSATLNVRLWLSTYVCARLRFCLRLSLLLLRTHFLPFCRRSSLRLIRLPLRLLRLRCLA